MSSRTGFIFRPPYPVEPGQTDRWGKLYGSAFGLATRELVEQHDGLVLIISSSPMDAQQLNEQINFYFQESDFEVLNFPDWETLPYDVFSPHQDIISERLETLYRLPGIQHGLLVVPVQTLMHHIPPCDYVQQRSFLLEKGQALSQDKFRDQLISTGYEHVSTVMEHGEFAIRGSLIDLFPMGSNRPYRIELFDNEIESLRTFDPDSQRTIEIVETLRMLPAREFPLDEQGIRQFRQSYRAQFEGEPKRSVIYREVSDGRAPAGIEYYIPLFFEETQSLFDYLPENALILYEQDVLEQAKRFHDEVEDRYESARHDIERPVLAPHALFFDDDALHQALEKFPQIEWQRHEHESTNAFNFDTHAPQQLLINTRSPSPAQELKEYITTSKARVLFAAESTGRRETLLGLLRDNQISPVQFSSWQAFLNSTEPLGITVAPLSQGLSLAEPALQVISETQLFGQQVYQRRRRTRQQRDSENIV
ncbi:MAG: transcription-repair coupling factor, partial [Thioalkalispiraceae bacterium]